MSDGSQFLIETLNKGVHVHTLAPAIYPRYDMAYYKELIMSIMLPRLVSRNRDAINTEMRKLQLPFCENLGGQVEVI